ncbi:MAG: hypothetical protein WCI74_10200, partial [Actinomycetes bacterium]
MRTRLVAARVGIVLAFCAAALVLSTAAASAEGAPRAVILVDGSVSMQGFYRAGSLRPVTESLANTLRESGYDVKIVVYRTKSDSGSDDDEIDNEGFEEISDAEEANGQHTFTDKALGKILKSGNAESVWIVTDNVVDTGRGDLDKDVRSFYKRLQSPSIAAFDLFPMKLQFSGRLLRANDSVLDERFNGPRGLITYGLLPAGLGDSAKKRYDDSVRSLEKSAGPAFASHLRVKPLLVPKDVELELVPVNPADVKGSAVALKLIGSRAADGSYHFAFPKPFKTNESIEGVFGLRLKGDTGPVVLDGVKVNVTMPRKFEGGDYASGDWKAVSKPETVTLGGLTPNSTQVLVTVKIPGGIDFKPGVSTSMSKFKSYWNLGVSGETSETLQSDVVVSLVAPGQEAKLDQSFINSWSVSAGDYFDKPTSQAGIPNLKQLFDSAKTTESTAPTTKEGVAAVDLDLQYPALIGALAVLGPLLGLLVAGAGVATYLAWRKSLVAARSLNGDWIVGPVPKASKAAPSEWADPSGLGGSGDPASGRHSRSRLAAMTRGIPLSDEGELQGWLK